MECHDESGILKVEEKEQQMWLKKFITQLWEKMKDLLGIVDTSKDDDSAGKEQDCLVAACAKYLTFYWKNRNIDRLVPLRSALIDCFGTYDRAWSRRAAAQAERSC